MNTTLLIVYVIVVLLMGLWVIWDLVKEPEKLTQTKPIFIDENKDIWICDPEPDGWRKLSYTIKDFEDYEHYWRNYY